MALTKEQKKYLKLSKAPETFKVVMSQGQGETEVGTYSSWKKAVRVAKKYEKDGSIGIRNKYGAFLNFQHNKTVEPGKTKLIGGFKAKRTKGTVTIFREHTSQGPSTQPEDTIVVSLGFGYGKKLRTVQATLSLAEFAKALTGLSGAADIQAVFKG